MLADDTTKSLGDNGDWQDTLPRYGLGDEFAALAGRNIITVAASGNSYNQFNRMGVAYPASDPAVLAVGALASPLLGRSAVAVRPTTALRIELAMQPKFSAGLQEWKVK